MEKNPGNNYFRHCLTPTFLSHKGRWCMALVTGIIMLLSAPYARAEEKLNVLDDIVVTGTKTPHSLQNVPVETVVISAEDIEKKNAGNIMDLLKDIPGIQTANHDDVFGTYTWQSKMRGLAFDSGYGLVLIDGQRAMGCGQSGGMGEYGIGLNQIPVEMIDHIEVVKGPGSALYGSDAMAGVINIITKKVPEEATGRAGVTWGNYDVKKENSDGSKQDGSGNRHIAKTYVSYGDRISDRLGYLLHYSYESADDIKEEPLQSDRHSFLGKFDAQPVEKLDLTLKYEAIDYTKTDNRDEGSYRISTGMDYQLTSEHLFALKGYTYTWNFEHGYPGNTHGYKYGDTGYNQGEILYTWHREDLNTFVIGCETQVQNIDYKIENDDGSLVVVDKDVRTSSLYIQDELSLFDSLTLVAGARYDDHSTFGDKVNPKFSLMYKPLKGTTVRASAGSSYKSPTIRQLYYSAPYRHGSFYAQSNPDLDPEKGVGTSASIEQLLLNNAVVIDLGYFRNDVDDMVVREDTGSVYNGLPLMLYKNVEKAWTQGIEFTGKTNLPHGLSATLSYTWTDSENEETGKELTYIAGHSASLSSAWDSKKFGTGVSTGISYSGKQYTNSENTEQIDASTVMNAKVYKHISEKAKLSFEADDLFDSKKSRDGSFYTGRALAVKLDVTF